MDKFARYYSWFLLVATALPALVRLTQARRFAQVIAMRIADPKARARHQLWGWISLIGSFILVPVYFFYSRKRWIIVAFVIGILTGIEMIQNAKKPDEDSLAGQNVFFGIGYAIAAAGTYFFLIRK